MNRNKFTNASGRFVYATALIFVIAFGASLCFSRTALAAETIFLDKPSIEASLAGDTMVISGNGFSDGDYVVITVEAAESSSLTKREALASMPVFADDDGSFRAGFQISALVSPTGRYLVRAEGMMTKTVVEIEVGALFAESADLDQCANGPFAVPAQCTGANWQNGSVNQNQGHYYEGDAIPYRMKFGDLTIGSTNTVVIEWDTTEGGRHAIDYLMSYNYTESTGNNPCSGIAGAHCAGGPGAPTSTFPIPLDPDVAGFGVTQIGGQVFSMWGGTITAVSGYSFSGSYAANSARGIAITFTANVVNPVLAWGGHIADRNDWAANGGSASDINGASYHMRLISINGSGGNQDRSLSNAAVRLASRITIVKDAQPNTSQLFSFTTTGGLTPSFTLQDDGNETLNPSSTTFLTTLAPASSSVFTVTEAVPSGFYQLQNIVCTVSAGGTSTTSASVPSRTATITLQYGDTVTCTFTNLVPTAAGAFITGTVRDAFGTPLSRTLVSVYNTTTGETVRTQTNQFGRYRVDDLPVGDFYVVTVSHRKHQFADGTLSFTLNDAFEGLDFTALP